MDKYFELENGLMDASDFELRDYSHESFASPSSEGNRLPRMRTAKKAAAELKKMDPGTYLTESMLRRLMKCHRIPYVTVGRRMLLNLDLLIERLAAGEELALPTVEEQAAEKWKSGDIRPVRARR